VDTNPYAPPKAAVGEVPSQAVAPALWNPNAAANWSLVFTPIFGAFLHMKNWQALGETGKARASRYWAILGAAVFSGLTLLAVLQAQSKGMGSLIRSAGFLLLLAWYFGSARAQARYVKERFGSQYPRRGWGKPLLVALGVFAVFMVAMIAVGVVIGVLSAGPVKVQ
jgi:hypothetical protein